MLVKVMTFNVHSCKSLDKKNTLTEIAELINSHNPAVVALNEIERYSPRTLFSDQAKKLAKYTNKSCLFGPAIKIGPFGFFGNALLSSFPVLKWQNIKLFSDKEFRAFIHAKLQLPGASLTVIVAHLGLSKRERYLQMRKIVNTLKGEKNPFLIMGDFNALEDEIKPLLKVTRDIGAQSGPTFPSDLPKARIDYILASKDILDYEVEVIPTDTSDHLPVLATLEIC